MPTSLLRNDSTTRLDLPSPLTKTDERQHATQQLGNDLDQNRHWCLRNDAHASNCDVGPCCIHIPCYAMPVVPMYGKRKYTAGSAFDTAKICIESSFTFDTRWHNHHSSPAPSSSHDLDQCPPACTLRFAPPPPIKCKPSP